MREKMKLKNTKQAVAALFIIMGLVFVYPAMAQELALQEKQVLETTKSLKKVIEENQGLLTKNQQLEEELNNLREAKKQGDTEVTDLRKERDRLSDNIKKVRSANREYSQEIKRLEGNLQNLQVVKLSANDLVKMDSSAGNVSSEEWAAPSDSWSSDHEMDDSAGGFVVASLGTEEVSDNESKTLDLLSRIDAFTEEDDRLRSDAAKAHYNMGNIYFQKGEYEIAAREYYQAVTLMPNDPDAHFNLAFVSHKFLMDFKTALKHFKMYLYLSPSAKDGNFVREQILHASMMLEGEVDSTLEKKY